MALPYRTTGSLWPTFVPARPVRLAVKHAFANAHSSAISDRAKRTFALLRYPFGGDRPSQTAYHALSLTRIHESRLEPQTNQAGISTLAPQELAPLLQSLPAILHRSVHSPMQSYSKGARGLSV
jgi:hypothetical protein